LISRNHTYVATFIIDTAARFWIADQHSEHVACARGSAVLSAGEMTFVVGSQIRVSAITSQSTGYCPEPVSWPSVQRVLDQVGLDHPTTWTISYEFRRCAKFECGVCDHPLSPVWNFDAAPHDDRSD